MATSHPAVTWTQRQKGLPRKRPGLVRRAGSGALGEDVVGRLAQGGLLTADPGPPEARPLLPLCWAQSGRQGASSRCREGEKDLAIAPGADDLIKYFLFSRVYVDQVFTVARGWVGREVRSVCVIPFFFFLFCAPRTFPLASRARTRTHRLY